MKIVIVGASGTIGSAVSELLARDQEVIRVGHSRGDATVDMTDGASIAAEVWALPPDGFGRFVAAVPAPLCVGTLLLADGTTPKGFLVEPEGLAGAEDITRYGGWRGFLAAVASPTHA